MHLKFKTTHFLQMKLYFGGKIIRLIFGTKVHAIIKKKLKIYIEKRARFMYGRYQ